MEEDRTKSQFKTVAIEEYYSRRDGIIYWHWRFANPLCEWNVVETAFKEIPWVTFDLPIDGKNLAMTTKQPREGWKEGEATAMNIVHQLGDLLYDTLPPDVAHEHFVKARQETNDRAIDFARGLIRQERTIAAREAVEDRERQIASWHKIPVKFAEEGKLGPITCDMCGGILFMVRGKHPGESRRTMCPTCAIEIIESIYSNLYPANQARQLPASDSDTN